MADLDKRILSELQYGAVRCQFDIYWPEGEEYTQYCFHKFRSRLICAVVGDTVIKEDICGRMWIAIIQRSIRFYEPTEETKQDILQKIREYGHLKYIKVWSSNKYFSEKKNISFFSICLFDKHEFRNNGRTFRDLQTCKEIAANNTAMFAFICDAFRWGWWLLYFGGS